MIELISRSNEPVWPIKNSDFLPRNLYRTPFSTILFSIALCNYFIPRFRRHSVRLKYDTSLYKVLCARPEFAGIFATASVPFRFLFICNS